MTLTTSMQSWNGRKLRHLFDFGGLTAFTAFIAAYLVVVAGMIAAI